LFKLGLDQKKKKIETFLDLSSMREIELVHFHP